MFEGAYPPGVTGKMIDKLEYPERCEFCTFFEERTCGYICGVLEAGYSAEELGSMSDAHFMNIFGKAPDDWCSDFRRWEE